jgi:hypothetical protein
MTRLCAWLLSASLLANSAEALELGKFAPERGALVASEKYSEFLEPCSREGPKHVLGTWQPTAAQIADLEARLPKTFFEVGTREAKSQGIELPDPSDYYRQYIGLIAGDRRVIYVNAFGSFVVEGTKARKRAGLPSGDWRTGVSWVCDDGIGGFGVEYDPFAKEFRNFEFDGCDCVRVKPEEAKP